MNIIKVMQPRIDLMTFCLFPIIYWMDISRHSSSIEIDFPNETKSIHIKSVENSQIIRPNFRQSKSEHGWIYAITDTLKNYFPHYNLQTSGTAFCGQLKDTIFNSFFFFRSCANRGATYLDTLYSLWYSTCFGYVQRCDCSSYVKA